MLSGEPAEQGHARSQRIVADLQADDAIRHIGRQLVARASDDWRGTNGTVHGNYLHAAQRVASCGVPASSREDIEAHQRRNAGFNSALLNQRQSQRIKQGVTMPGDSAQWWQTG